MGSEYAFSEDPGRMARITGAGSSPREGDPAVGARKDGFETSRPPRVALEAVPGFEPTVPELRISARLLLHIGRQPRFGEGELVPGSLTQAGMAEALGTTQAAVSHALGRLVLGGLLEVRRAHVRGRRQRVKVYQLTELGESLVRHIRASMGP
ncbi:MAG TPA: helix-turn-helix domain-containing protein [Thermoplasmata archaeon]|nr:helix-turn-helix domain-containing protein [Thermoplasmata archaeon]